MNFQELKEDLFSDQEPGIVYAHCISADCAMGAGIAKQFVKRYPEMKAYCWEQKPKVGTAVFYIRDRSCL